MARVGRFGRNRRLNGQSNLTQIIAGLMREQRQAEDRAAFDAWQNGGEYKGKPMTDARILAYAKGRRDMMATDDPLWDEWNNTLIQTKFSIGEQKIGLSFQQGKVGAGAVAAWYRSQLSKIPKDSAFYRTVAGRAAEWAKSAAGSARGSARGAAGQALETRYERLTRRIQAADALEAAIEQEARRRGVLYGNGSLSQADATAVEAMFDGGLLVNGVQVTYDDWRQTALDRYGAWVRMGDVYRAKGWDPTKLHDDQQKALRTLTGINAVDDKAKYELARDLWLRRIDGAQGDPDAIARATADYDAALAGIHASASSPTGKQENDPDFLGGLLNERSALQGKYVGPSVATITGQAESDDAEKTATDIVENAIALKALNNGTGRLVQDEPGGQYFVDTDPWGTIDMDPGYQTTVVYINGKLREVALKGVPVRSAMLVAPDGSVVPVDQIEGSIQKYLDSGYAESDGGQTVGYVYTTGRGQTTFGVYDANGVLKFTDENPFTSWAPNREGGLSVFGSALKPDAKGVVRVDTATLTRPEPQTWTAAPITGGTDANTVAGFLEAQGDTETAAAIRAQFGTPTTLGNGQVSDSQAERNGFGVGSFTPRGEQSVVQGALSATMGAIQSSLSGLFTPTPTAPPKAEPEWKPWTLGLPGQQGPSLKPPPTTLTSGKLKPPPAAPAPLTEPRLERPKPPAPPPVVPETGFTLTRPRERR